MDVQTSTDTLRLNEPQTRVLATGIRRLADTAGQLSRLLDSKGADEGLNHPSRDIPPSEAEQLRAQLADIRVELKALAALVGVAPERQSVRRLASALSAGAWTVAEDLHPTQLRRYGPVDSTAQLLAPHMERLAALFFALTGRLDGLDRDRESQEATAATTGAGSGGKEA